MAHEAHPLANLMNSRGVSRRAVIGGGLALLALPVLAACASAEPTPTPTSSAAAAPTAAATATTAASPAATSTSATSASPTTAAAATTQPTAASTPGAKLGGSVNVLATWSGDEQDSFLAMVKPFEDQSGVKVEYEGTRDLNAVLATRVQGGNPPEVAGLPGPGQMAEFAKDGKLVDLSGILDLSAMKQQYAEDWLKLGEADGKQVGIFIKAALKGPIWYNPKVFKSEKITIPQTWDSLMKVAQGLADAGKTPWSIGLESGAASGWPGTDWIEDIVLRQAGPDVYDKWYQGQQKWTSPEIKTAWETWGSIVGDPKMVYGGKQYMLATSFQDAADPLFTTPPHAYLHHQASFITGFITGNNPALKPVDDFAFFPFPEIDSSYAGAIEGAGDLFGMFKQTDQASALITYLTTPEAQAIWVKRGGALSPNQQVSLDDYPDQLSKDSAKALTSASIVRFDASDLMPEAMNQAFMKAILDFVGDPSKLDAILADLDKTQADAYK